MKIEIDDKHIEEAEQIFIRGNIFDKKDRIPFIKNLETCDLLAVPGSGKTTALMAKLYCLSKQLPFKDGSGILVLAHTNATVEEIEKELKRYCPNLFEYPNFIGTIQSFTNKFLANPANFIKHHSYIAKNDDDIYKKEVVKFYYSLEWKKAGEIDQKLKNLLYGKANHGRGNISTIEKNANTIDFIYHLKLDFINRKILSGSNNSTLYKYGGQANNYYLEIEKWKEELLKNGILSYIDSFYLAKWYLKNFPETKAQLQHRFKYVFIDEMQDLEIHQINLIDDIFEKGKSNSIMQRIGDPNQSIYNKVKDDCDWKPRNEIYLTGSNRLTKANAELVNYFTFKNNDENFKIVGERKFAIGEKEIMPHLILFREQSKDKLKDKFKELIQNYNLHQIEAKNKCFKIIGWAGERSNEGDGKFCLHTLFNYTKNDKSRKEDFDTLSKYIQLFNYEKETLESVRKTILNAFIAILRFENIKIIKVIRGKEVSRYYTKNDLIEFIKKYKQEELNIDIQEEFKSKLYKWCFELVTLDNYENIFKTVKEFILSDFKEWFNLEINPTTKAFIQEFTIEKKSERIETKSNDFNIDVTTVHSVKGQTHCATMYVETAYYDYETQKLDVVSKKATKTKLEERLPNPLFDKCHQYRIGSDSRAKEALKMMYVGFSRPTHLLCFAVLEDNVKNNIEKYESAGWVIIDDLIKII